MAKSRTGLSSVFPMDFSSIRLGLASKCTLLLFLAFFYIIAIDQGNYLAFDLAH